MSYLLSPYSHWYGLQSVEILNITDETNHPTQNTGLRKVQFARSMKEFQNDGNIVSEIFV